MKEQRQSSAEQVFYLEASDDLPIIREMLSWSMARRVILVVHPRSRVLRSKVNLKVLQRYGVDLGKEIALVTADRTTRDLAYEVGLPTFFNVERARQVDWPGKDEVDAVPVLQRRLEKPRRRKRSAWQMKMESPRILQTIIASLLFLVVLVLLGGGALMVLPGATVAMAPVTEPIERMIEITADPNVDQIDYEAGVVPARLLGVEVEASTQITYLSQARLSRQPREGQGRARQSAR